MGCEISQRVRFECCYLVDSEINAHEYQFEATVKNVGEPSASGRVLNFADLKDLIEKIVPSNRFLFDTTSQNVGREVAFIIGQRGVPVSGYPFKLSAENLCRYFGERLSSSLEAHFSSIRVVAVKLRENSNSFATWTPND